MLPKKNRGSRKDIDAIFKKGSFLASPSFTFKFVLNNTQTQPKVSVIVPKTVEKRSTKRNLLRRRGYAALRSYKDKLPSGLQGAFIFKKASSKVSNLENDIKNILDKIN